MSTKRRGPASRGSGPHRHASGLLLAAVTGWLCCCPTSSARASGADGRPALDVPVTGVPPTIDGTLDDACWQAAARTSPLRVTGADASTAATEAFLLRDADHLYVGLRCAGKLAFSTSYETSERSDLAAPPFPLHLPPGSHVAVAHGLPADPLLTALTLEVWVWPAKLNRWQTFIAQHNYPTACGYGLFLDNEGRLQFYLGDGGAYRSERSLAGPVLTLREWQHVVGTWDGKIKSLRVNGRLVAQQAFEGPVQPGAAPLWLGACGSQGVAVNYLDGVIAMPAIYGKPLSADEIDARVRDRGRTPPANDAVLACWKLADERGDRVLDLSSHARHGAIVDSAADAEFADLLIDSNADRNSYYLIRMTPQDGGKITSSYLEHLPPWHDRTWQPPLAFAVSKGSGEWTAEVALPLEAFCKNKTLASEIGFNLRRHGTRGTEAHVWHGADADPGSWGTLTGIPARAHLPDPEYAAGGLSRFYRPPNRAGRSFLAEQAERTVELGPGSAHHGSTGEVRLELEGFWLSGDPHARGIIWDLAVDEARGELYVLSDTRPVRGVAEIRVFDRRGEYLRTIMPLNPNLPPASVRDLCRATVREMDTVLVVPKLFEPWGEPSFYGDWWHHPQKMALTPDGDLILANIYKGILWRMNNDGSLPAEGWTSAYHAGRNEPFESTAWTQDMWMVPELKNYLPFHALHYPYFCFDPQGALHISAGQSTRPTRQYAYHFEVSHQEVSHARELTGSEGRGAYVWQCRVHPGARLDEQSTLGGFAAPSGLVHDGEHLIVADSGHNRLQVFSRGGQLVATITHYQHAGEQIPIHGPTALAMDRDRCLYLLVASKAKSPDGPVIERTLPSVQEDYLQAARTNPDDPTTLIKLKSWREPTLLARSEPLHRDALQIAVDAGASPPLVWVANGCGLGSLVQLASRDLSIAGRWGDRCEPLRCPRQSGGQPILNIDPLTGHLYVEDDSDYRLKRHGTVYRIDQQGTVMKTWPSAYFNDLSLNATSPWWTLDYDRHYRCPDEPLFIDSVFGKDGRVYRWKLTRSGVEILRFDRDGVPLEFLATGTNALFVDHAMHVGFWHDVYHGLEVDRHGNIYYAAKVDVVSKARPVSAEAALHRQLDIYNADGELIARDLLRLDAVRGIQVDDDGNLFVLHRPADRPWEDYLALEKFSRSGGKPIWSVPWDSYYGWAQVANPPCHCTAFRLHQVLDERGYLYAARKHSVQVIDGRTGKVVGEFGSYGNMDCRGKDSRCPHPELPFGAIAALSVWKDRLFAVDVVNRRIVVCRIVHDGAAKRARP